MHAHSSGPQVFRLCRASVQAGGLAYGHSKFMLLQSGRDVRMGVSGNIRIHAERDACKTFEFGRASGELVQFRLALQIEQQNIGPKCGFHFGGCLADAGKNDISGCTSTCPPYALQFSARNHVKSATELLEQPQNAEIGVGFYGVVNRVLDMAKCKVEGQNTFANRSRGIDIERGPEPLREFSKRDFFAAQNFAGAAWVRPVNESWRPLGKFTHLRADAFPFTLMATTVWSSKVSTPEACSAAALKMDFTIDSADFSEHSVTIFSSRVRPKRSPALLVASRIPSLKKTKTSSGSAWNVISSYSASSKSPSGKPVASIIWVLPWRQYTGRGRPEFETCKVRLASSQSA